MDQNRPNFAQAPIGRGQRIQAMKELQLMKSKTIVELEEQEGQFEDVPAVSPRVSTAAAAAAARGPESDHTHAYLTSPSVKTRSAGPKRWTDNTVDAIVNGSAGRKNGHVAGGSGRRETTQGTGILPPSQQAIWSGRRIRDRTSFKGYEVGYLDMMLEKEKNSPKMSDESWD